MSEDIQLSKSKQAFSALLAEFCRKYDIPDAATVIDTGMLSADGINITLVHHGKNPDQIILMAELGKQEGVEEVVTYKRMLELNMLTMLGDGPRFVIDPFTNTMMVTALLKLSDITAESLGEGISVCAQMVNQWRSGVLYAEAGESVKENLAKSATRSSAPSMRI